LIFAVGI